MDLKHESKDEFYYNSEVWFWILIMNRKKRLIIEKNPKVDYEFERRNWIWIIEENGYKYDPGTWNWNWKSNAELKLQNGKEFQYEI